MEREMAASDRVWPGKSDPGVWVVQLGKTDIRAILLRSQVEAGQICTCCHRRQLAGRLLPQHASPRPYLLRLQSSPQLQSQSADVGWNGPRIRSHPHNHVQSHLIQITNSESNHPMITPIASLPLLSDWRKSSLRARGREPAHRKRNIQDRSAPKEQLPH